MHSVPTGASGVSVALFGGSAVPPLPDSRRVAFPGLAARSAAFSSLD